MATLELRPEKLNARFRPGNPIDLSLDGDDGWLQGVILAATLGAESFAPEVDGDTLYLRATAEQATAIAEEMAAAQATRVGFVLTDTLTDRVLLVGGWTPSLAGAGVTSISHTILIGAAPVRVKVIGGGTGNESGSGALAASALAAATAAQAAADTVAENLLLEAAERSAQDGLAILRSEFGAVGGPVPIGEDGTIPPNFLPAITITTVDVVASEAAMLALDVTKGAFAIREDLGRSFVLATTDPTSLADWVILPVPDGQAVTIDGVSGPSFDLTQSYQAKSAELALLAAVTSTPHGRALLASASPAATRTILSADSSNEVSTKVSTAKTEAIAAAATDATTKAGTAKTEAIAAAATDATTKANAAQAAAVQRANHSGTQSIASIVGLQAALDTLTAAAAPGIVTREYSGSSWPARGTVPTGAIVIWINRTNSTPPAAGGTGYAATDLVLVVA